MKDASSSACLIVNADDYGFFRCVDRGIVEASVNGIVTATGVFANGPRFEEDAAVLREMDGLDVGVHLNLTDGVPLTANMRKKLARWSGRFPRKFAMAAAILSGSVGAGDAAAEWRAQIDRCLAHGLRLRFLNSHEHLHMLPPLFPVAAELAAEYGISHLRFPTAPRAGARSAAALVRKAVITLLGAIDRRVLASPVATFLGLEVSGQLDRAYLERCIPALRPGCVYELMCHPGRFDAAEIDDPRLRRYHDWEGELRALTDPGSAELLRRNRVRLIGYRHLDARGGELVVRSDAGSISS